ncbi:MAG: hypothetical protein WDZ76_02650 [Pseudohongiellaceae bacterium]
MTHKSFSRPFSRGLALLVAVWLPVTAVAQSSVDLPVSQSGFVVPGDTLTNSPPLFSVQRSFESSELGGMAVDASNLNLGLTLSPLEGLSVRADAWKAESEQAANGLAMPESGWHDGLSRLYLGESGSEAVLENSFLKPARESNGFDLGAAYIWDTDSFGQFTLSTRASYVYDFRQNGNTTLLELSPVSDVDADFLASPELQGTLTLSWQFGNHTASAITNHFDSFKEISELDIDEINELVDNITTVDLQYGYSLKAGKSDQAIFSFGIRNIFDKKATQILNRDSRILDQNGRVAYGSIKYQF